VIEERGLVDVAVGGDALPERTVLQLLVGQRRGIDGGLQVNDVIGGLGLADRDERVHGGLR
jgi:hypothetical protein